MRTYLNLFNGQRQTLIKDGKIRAMYLPKNTTVLIQPLDQGIIYSFKVNCIGFLLIVKKYKCAAAFIVLNSVKLEEFLDH